MCLLISVFLDIFSVTFTVNPKLQGVYFLKHIEEGWGGSGLIETEDLCEVAGGGGLI